MITKQTAAIIFGACAVTYLLGMFFIPLMDIDAAQYASISREMLERKSYLQFYDLGKDYLDKPPMLFWLSGLSLSVFGIHDWAFRLPSFLFACLAVYSTYKLAFIFYKKDVALLSAIILATSQAMFLITHDVRCDTVLMGWVIFSLWQLTEWYQTKKIKNFLFAFIGIAGGMLTKGPVALMVPVFAFALHFILRREWKQFLKWEYLLGIIIIAVLLFPMSVGLYMQYDMHPGKIINTQPVQSGLKFYYWTQSFGRYTGENYFKENDSFVFLLQNMLWSFLPWIILFLFGLFNNIFDLIRNKFYLNHHEEFITTGGFILTYIVLARSQYQLPHYIFVVFPLAAIITANYLYKIFTAHKNENWHKIFTTVHFVIFNLLWLAVFALMAFVFPSIPKVFAALALLGLVGLYIIYFSGRTHFPKLIMLCAFTVIGVNIFLDTEFYPHLLTYQRGSQFADYINQNKIDKDKIVLLGLDNEHSLAFYAEHIFPVINSQQLQKGNLVIAKKDSLQTIRQKFVNSSVITQVNSFHVTGLTFRFLNPKTREKELQPYVLVNVQ